MVSITPTTQAVEPTPTGGNRKPSGTRYSLPQIWYSRIREMVAVTQIFHKVTAALSSQGLLAVVSVFRDRGIFTVVVWTGCPLQLRFNSSSNSSSRKSCDEIRGRKSSSRNLLSSCSHDIKIRSSIRTRIRISTYFARWMMFRNEVSRHRSHRCSSCSSSSRNSRRKTSNKASRTCCRSEHSTLRHHFSAFSRTHSSRRSRSNSSNDSRCSFRCSSHRMFSHSSRMSSYLRRVWSWAPDRRMV